MSATVDSRVLEMRFDNSQFESGVKTSMSTLERLKQALHLKGASDGLNQVNAAAKKCNLSPLAQGIDSVKVKFSALQVAGAAALANITNSAVNAGKNLVNAFAFEPITTGFKEYETQIGAVQTILANTQHQGTNLEQVNAALDELNHYADKTIYNFTEMTRNIGTFTAAGVDLDTSVNSIKGIANLAAISGSTSQQASTAMYQLSQALAAGKVQLMDWNSVVNAGMGGKVFQDALIRTSELLGTGAKAAIESQGSFRESLTKTGWLTTEVLTETLNQFAGAYSEADLIQQGYSESQAKEIANMAVTAEDAATKVKTFTQLMDTLKEAAQSGWTQSWETIVGDFEEAKTLWTKVSDTVGGMIEKSANDRNQMLSGALDSKWDTFIEKVNEAGVSTDEFQEKIKEAATEHGVNLDKMIEEQGSFREVVSSGSLSSDIFVDALKKVSGSQTQLSGSTEDLSGKLNKFQQVVDQVWQGDFKNGEERVRALTEAGYDYAEVQDLVNKTVDGHRLTLEDLSDAQLQSVGYTEEQISKIHELAEQAEQTGTPINDLIKQLERPSGRWLMIDSIKNAFTGITTALSSVKQAWKQAFYGDASDEEIAGIKAERLYNIIDGIHNFSEKLVMTEGTADKLKRTFQGVFSIFSLVSTFAGGALSLSFKAIGGILSGLDLNILDVTANIGDAITRFKDWVNANNLITKAFEKIGQGIKTAYTGVKGFIQTFSQLPQVQQFVSGIGQTLSTVFSNIQQRLANAVKMVQGWIEAFSNAKSLSDVGKILGNIGNAFRNIFANFDIEEMFNNAITSISNFRSELASNLQAAGIDLEGLKTAFGSAVDFITSHIGALAAIVSGAILIRAIDRIGEALKTLASPLEALNGIFESISGAIDDFAAGMTKFFKAKAFESRTVGIRNIALAVTMLAGSLALLSQVDQGSLWSSVGALTALTAVLSVLSILVSRLGNLKGLAGMSGSLLALSASLLMVAQCVNMINDLSGAEIAKGLGVVTGFTAILTALMAATRLVAGSSIKGLGKTMIQLSIAMGLLVGVVKMVSGLEAGEIAKGLLVMALFEGIMAGMAAITHLVGKNDFSKLGSTVMKLSIAMGILVGVIRMISGIEPADLAKGLATMAALDAIIAGLAAVSNLAGKNAPKAGAMILQISLAFMALAGVIKIIEGMEPASLIKGIAVIAALSAIVGALVAVSNSAGKHAAKAGLMILEISGAMLILAGLIAIIDNMDVAALAKGIVVIGLLSAIIAGLMAASGLAGKAKGTLIGLTIAISAFAALIAALSLLDPAQALPAAASLGLVIAAFAALVAATGQIKTKHLAKSLVTLGLLTGLVVLLDNVISALSEVPDANAALKMAASMSLLVTALSASSAILSRCKPLNTGALAALGSLTLAVGILGGVIAALGKFDMSIGIESAASLSLLVNALSAATLVLSQCKPINTGALAGLGSLTLAVGILGGLVAALGKFDMNISLESVTALSVLAVSLSAACVLLGKAGPAASAAVPAVAKLSAVLGVISAVILAVGAIGAGIEHLAPGALDAVTNALGKIGTALGSFFGGIVGGFSIQATSGLGEAGKNIAEFVNSFSGVSMEGVEGAKAIAEAIAFLAGANLFNTITEKLGGGNSNMAAISSQLPVLGEGLASFGASLSNLSEGDIEKIKMAGEAAKALAEFASEIPNQGGALASLVGDNMISSWGPQLPAFGEALSEFSASVAGIDTDAIKQAADAATALAEFADTISNEGGALASLVGDNTIGSWGPQLPAFGEYLSQFSQSVSGIDAGAIKQAADAATALAEFADTISNEGGLVAKFTGENSLGAWGPELSAFGTSLADFSQSVSGIDTGAITEAAAAAKALADFSDAIPDQGGIVTWFQGDNTASTFGDELVSFGQSLSEFSQSLVGVNVDAVNKAADAARGLADLGNILPESGGFLSIFTADNDFSTFGNELAKFGESLGKFSTSIEGANIDAMTGAADSVGTLVSAFSRMKSLDPSIISSFKTALESLGDIDFDATLDSLSGINGTELDSLTDLVTTLNSMARIDTSSVTSLKNTLQGISEIDFSTFKFDAASADAIIEQLKAFRDKLKELCDSFSGLDFPAIDSAVSSLGRIKDLVQGMTGLDTTSVSSYITAVELLSGIEIGGIFTSGTTISTENISALSRLGGVIRGLAGIDTTGVGAYITAVELLSGMTVDGILTGDKIKTENLTGINMLTSSIRGMVGLDNSGVSAFTEGLQSLSGVTVSGVLGDDFSIDQTKVSCINGLTSAFTGMVGLDASGASAFKTAMQSLSEITISGLLSDSGDLDINIASKITGLVGAINSMVNINISGVESFKKAMEDLNDIDINGFFEQLSGASNQAVTAGTNIMNGLATGINQGKATVSSAMKSAVQTLENAAKGQGSTMEAAGQNLMSKFASGLNRGKSQVGTGIVTSAVNPILTAINAKAASFQSAGQSLMSRFSSGLSAGGAKVPSSVNNVVASALSMINTKTGQFQSAGQNLFGKFVSGITSSSGKVTSAINTVLNSAINAISSKEGTFQTKGLVLISNTAQGIQSGSSLVNAATMSAVSSAASALSSYYSQFYSAGSYLMQGFAAGIDSQGAAAVAKAKSYAQQAASAVKSALEIASPSKVMYRLGRFAVMGFANAFEDGNATATKVGIGLATAAVVGFSKAATEIVETQKIVNDESLSEEDKYWSMLLKKRQNGVDGAKYQEMSLLDFKKEVTSKSIALLDDYTKALEDNTKALIDNSNLFKQQEAAEVDSSLFEGIGSMKESTSNLFEVSDGISNLVETTSNTSGLFEAADNTSELFDVIEERSESTARSTSKAAKSTSKAAKTVEKVLTPSMFMSNLAKQTANLKEYDSVMDSLGKKLSGTPLQKIAGKMGADELDNLKVINGLTADQLKQSNKLLQAQSKSDTNAFIRNFEKQTDAVKDYETTLAQVGKKYKDSPLKEIVQEMGIEDLDSLRVLNSLTGEQVKQAEKMLQTQNKFDASTFIRNFEKQTDSVKEYESVLAQVGEKFKNSPINEIVQEMGVEDLKSLKVLNSLTDDQIKQAEKMLKSQNTSDVNAFIRNFERQTGAIQNYEDAVESLSEKYKDSPLKDIIQDMGVEDLDNLKVLNSLTDDQIKQAEEMLLEKRSSDAKVFLRNIKAKTASINEYEAAYNSLMGKLGKSQLTDVVSSMGVEDLENLKMLDSLTVEELASIETAYAELTAAEAAFAEKRSISAQTMITNLEADNAKLEEYKAIYESVIQKVHDTPLADVVAEMGLESLEQLKIINGMNEEELAKATELLNKKAETAASIAELQTQSMYEQNMISKSIELVNQYTDAIEENTESIFNRYGLFDKPNLSWKSDQNVWENSINGMISNVREQTSQLEVYISLMEKVPQRSALVGSKLAEDMKSWTIDQVNELAALNGASDEKLEELVKLYDRKFELAGEAGVVQTQDTKTELEETLSELFGGIDVDLDEFEKEFDGTFDSIEKYVKGKRSEFVESGRGIGEGIADGVRECLPLVKSAAEQLIAAAKQTITQGMASIRASAGGSGRVAGTIGISSSGGGSSKTSSSSSASSAKKTGSSVSKGLANGIKSGLSTVAKAAAGVAGAAIGAIASALKVHSPSRVTYELGEYSSQGFINAFIDYESKASAAGADIAESAMYGLSKALAKIQRVVNNDIETQPTIRPVLDMSDLNAGADKIGGMFALAPSVGMLSKVNRINSRMNNIQNGRNTDVINAIKELKASISGMSSDTYNINGITYDDGSNITDAVKTIVRAARVERRR